MQKKKMFTMKPTLIALSIAQVIASQGAQAATIHVGGQQGKGCGLSAAILSANQDITHPGSQCIAGDGDDIIELHRDITIFKSWKEDDGNSQKVDTFTGMPKLLSNITINGNGHTIRRDLDSPEFRLLASENVNVVLDGLVLKNGRLRGGAIDSLHGDLTIANSEISGNHSAISRSTYDYRTTIVNSTFTGNTGRVLNINQNKSSSASIRNSRFENNEGSAIYSSWTNYYNDSGSVSIVDSVITGNTGSGVQIYRSIDVNIDNTLVSENARGVELDGSKGSIRNSVVSNNSDKSCAGINLTSKEDRSYTDIFNTTISNNTATDTVGGGVCAIPGVDYYDYATPVNVTLENSILVGNSAKTDGGAIFTSSVLVGPAGGVAENNRDVGTIALNNSTVSNNSAGRSAGGIHLFSRAGTYPDFSLKNDDVYALRLVARNSTITGNSAGVQGGGINAGAAYLDFANSIIAGNVSAGSAAEINVYTPRYVTAKTAVIGSVNNLFGSSTVTNFQAFSGFTPSTTDITATIDGTTPTSLESMIKPLSDNRGTTRTHALTSVSPALAAGDVIVCGGEQVKGVDQRGKERGVDRCDIGAFESTLEDALGFTASVTEALEGKDRFIVLSLTLDQAQDTPVSIDFETQDSSAVAGSDYVGRVGRLNFQPGEVTKRRWFEVLDNDEVENEEAFFIRLSSNDTDERTGVKAKIEDDDLPFAVNLTSNVEGKSLVATVTLAQAFDSDYRIAFETINGSAFSGNDYVARSNVMNFKAGEVSKERWFNLLPDNLVEGDESFEIRFTSVDDPSIEVIETATIQDAN